MIYLYKKVPNNRNTSYRLRSCSINAHKEGVYHVIEIEQGSPLIRQLKILHGFTERKQKETYNAIRDIKKDSQKVKRSIVESAKKVEKIEKPKKTEKKKTTKRKTKTSLNQKNTKI